MKCVLVDLDGTLCNLDHRLHFVRGNKRNYDEFHARVGDDLLYEDVYTLVKCLARDYAIVLCSCRPEKARETTEAWLEGFEVPYSGLYMRADEDSRADYIVKIEMLKRIAEDGFDEVLFVLDDRRSVVEAWRRDAGLTCFQVRDWDDRRVDVAPGLLSVMVGPSGAGKSDFVAGLECYKLGESWVDAQELGILPHHVVSSDLIREDLCRDFRDQSRNDEVFAVLHRLVRERVRSGLPCVVDATNIRDADRKAVVALSDGGPVRYIVIDRPLKDKVRDAEWRGEVMVKGVPLVVRHHEVMQANLKAILSGDGFSNVEVIDLRSL